MNPETSTRREFLIGAAATVLAACSGNTDEQPSNVVDAMMLEDADTGGAADTEVSQTEEDVCKEFRALIKEVLEFKQDVDADRTSVEVLPADTKFISIFGKLRPFAFVDDNSSSIICSDESGLSLQTHTTHFESGDINRVSITFAKTEIDSDKRQILSKREFHVSQGRVILHTVTSDGELKTKILTAMPDDLECIINTSIGWDQQFLNDTVSYSDCVDCTGELLPHAHDVVEWVRSFD